MEEDIGVHQLKLQVLPKVKTKMFGTQLNLEKFLINLSKLLPQQLPKKTKLRIRELLLLHF